MNKRSLEALIALNVVLLVALAVTMLTPAPARAQIRNRGTYTITGGPAIGHPNFAMLYIVEGSSMRMIALLYSSADNTLTPVDNRAMLDDLK
jgi:hypothetical protein